MAAAATAVRTLIVEDDPDACDALAAVLQRHGFEVDCAASVGEALLKMEVGLPPTVIILDLKLPDANGTLLLRRVHRASLPTKVAVVTGDANPKRYPELERFPPDRVFIKPLDMLELVEWLNTFT